MELECLILSALNVLFMFLTLFLTLTMLICYVKLI